MVRSDAERRPRRPRLWADALEAIVWLALAGVAVRLVPFRRIAPLLGEPQRETPGGTDARDAAVAHAVRRAVDAASRRAPWRCTCLSRAAAAKAMLRRRGVVSTLYLGVRNGPDGALEAHAWLRCGDAVLTGGAERAGFAVVATFAEPGR